MALLQAHEPAEATADRGRVSGNGVNSDHDRTRWSTADWLEVAALIEKPVLSVNSEHGNRKDERAFAKAFRAGQLTVRVCSVQSLHPRQYLSYNHLTAFRLRGPDWSIADRPQC